MNALFVTVSIINLFGCGRAKRGRARESPWERTAGTLRVPLVLHTAHYPLFLPEHERFSIRLRRWANFVAGIRAVFFVFRPVRLC